MLGPVGMPELIIVLVIVLIIFGAGKLSEIGGALGSGIREFRNAANSDDEAASDEAKATAE